MENKKYPELNRVYKHYKGGTYEVLTMAKHIETNEDLVIYFSREFGSVYARPLSEWFDLVKRKPELQSVDVSDVSVKDEECQRFSLYNGY